MQDDEVEHGGVLGERAEEEDVLRVVPSERRVNALQREGLAHDVAEAPLGGDDGVEEVFECAAVVGAAVP